MPKYDFVATSLEGAKKTGKINAPNIESAREKLNKEHDIIVSITEAGSSRTYFWQRPKF